MLQIKEKGFTFLEVIIAVFILVVGIVAAYLVSQTPIFYTQNSINRLTAAFLAQEGIEIVRNIRDNNWLDNDDWNDELDERLGNNFYEADYSDDDLVEKTGGPNLLQIDDNVFYNYGDGNDSKFTRKINIKDQSNYLKITSKVEWTHKGKDYEIVVEDHLYNWWKQ